MTRQMHMPCVRFTRCPVLSCMHLIDFPFPYVHPSTFFSLQDQSRTDSMDAQDDIAANKLKEKESTHQKQPMPHDTGILYQTVALFAAKLMVERDSHSCHFLSVGFQSLYLYIMLKGSTLYMSSVMRQSVLQILHVIKDHNLYYG